MAATGGGGTAEGLECVVLLERDRNEDLLTTWVYPAAEEGLREALQQYVEQLAAAALVVQGQQQQRADDGEAAGGDVTRDPPHPIVFTKYKTSWVYIQGADGKETGTMVWVVIVGSAFNPERYEALLKTMVNLHNSTGSPPKLLECFLSVQIKGRYQQYASSDYDPRKALLVSNIKELIAAFGLEFILVWTAILMKKRIAVYGSSVSEVIEAVRGLPVLVWHRQDWSLLRPWVALEDKQIDELRSAGVFVAGFTDAGVRGMPDLYDLFIDLDNRSIRLMEHAAPDFKMGIFHKELATYLVQAANDPDQSTQLIIKELAVRTKDLLSKLAALRVEHEDGNKYITLEADISRWEQQGLQARKLPPNMDRFLYNVAGAENMTFNTHK